jgi:diguanylate cyclase (GGDEF)-like protein
MVRLLICDDAPETRTLVRTMLADHPEIEIVGEAADGSEAVAMALELTPDVVVMDVTMPVLDGVEATRRLHELAPAVRIVAFAGSDDAEVVQAMLDAGASAYCVKGSPLWDLEHAIIGATPPLFRLAHAATRAVSAAGLAQLAARELAELSGAVFAAAYLGPDEASLSLAGAAGPAAPPDLASMPTGAPDLVRRAVREGAPAQGDAEDAAELLSLTGAPCGPALAVPLLFDGETLGGLVLALPANVLFEVDHELVRAAAELTAAALASSRSHALTRAEARTDPLTGLPNRRAFEEHLREVLAVAAARGGEVALALIDLDDFKQVNDRRGHSSGDRVLRTIGRVLSRTTRADEEVFRIGGDEFALVVSGPWLAAGRALERIREGLARQRRANGLPTVSAGIASASGASVSGEQLVDEADAALYAAKGAGKDRVVGPARGAERKGKKRAPAAGPGREASEPTGTPPGGSERHPLRVLVVDDDPSLRMLLRTTFEIIDIDVEEAESTPAAEAKISLRPPDVMVLDVDLPGEGGLVLCRRLRTNPVSARIPVVLLTGLHELTEEEAAAAGANALLRKPFSPLELLSTIERLAGGLYEGPFQLMAEERPPEQLLLYAQDLRRLLEIERSQRMLLQQAYEETASALAAALESKDFGTSAHSQRVRRYATELARTLDSRLLADQSLEYGFLLHDVGKIGVPDSILLKRGALTPSERRVMQSHTLLGEQMLRDVPLLQGQGLSVIRSHHERWDGSGYPDGLTGEQIPAGARVFAVADALDAMTSDRPYRAARDWSEAMGEIESGAEAQFDPGVVEAFARCETRLRRIYYELRAA